MSFSRRGIVVAIVFFISAASMAECSCKNRFLFYPYREIVAVPSDEGFTYEDVYFRASDGVRLNGWWVPAGKGRGAVLFCHGNGGNISFLIQTVGIYKSMGLDVFLFDYRGYGRSEGVPTEEGTCRDVEAAWYYLTGVRKIEAGKIVVIGRSLGGAMAAWLCAARTPRALVLESTFTRAADVANFHYPLAPGMLLFGDTYDTAALLARVRCPVLVIHSPEDEIVPYELGEKLFRIAPEPKEMLVIRGPHNTGFMMSATQYASGIEQFLRKHI
ncbi:MAG: alpha/beta hydrolase [Spirochaetes bacterium]|nr:alpha/beta hydrolase [Spirochaetota bacterium]